MFDIVTLVLHHPLRKFECLIDNLHTLVRATKLKHLIDLRVQGELGKRQHGEIDEFVAAIGNGTELQTTMYRKNVFTVQPRLESVSTAKGEGAAWWAKLDDDTTIETGGWDKLISCIELTNAGCAMANPNGEMRAKDLVTLGNQLHLLDSPNEPVRFGELAFTECDFVGDGATVFDMNVFSEGAEYDSNMKLGGADIDLAYQMKLMGFRALMCNPPISTHTHKLCSSKKYDKIRYNAERIAKSGKVFREKWGVDIPHLSQFGMRVK